MAWEKILGFECRLSGRQLKFTHQRARFSVGQPDFAWVVTEAIVNFKFSTTGGVADPLGLRIINLHQVAQHSLRDRKGVGLRQTAVFSRHLVGSTRQPFHTRGLFGHIVFHNGRKRPPVGTRNGVFHGAGCGRTGN